MQDGPDEIEAKLLLGKDFEMTAHRANLIVDTELGEQSGDDVNWGVSWSSRYKYKDAFQPGFEFHGAFGDIGSGSGFEDQDHRLGPVFYGKIGEGFSYDAGYLLGVSDAAPDGTIKVIGKYRW